MEIKKITHEEFDKAIAAAVEEEKNTTPTKEMVRAGIDRVLKNTPQG